MKMQFTQNFSSKEVYDTDSLMFLVENMRCSNLGYQKGFESRVFSHKIVVCRTFLCNSPSPIPATPLVFLCLCGLADSVSRGSLALRR